MISVGGLGSGVTGGGAGALCPLPPWWHLLGWPSNEEGKRRERRGKERGNERRGIIGQRRDQSMQLTMVRLGAYYSDHGAHVSPPPIHL